MIERLICSDLHAGLATSRWNVLVHEVKKCNPKQVIMIGDVVDSNPSIPVDPLMRSIIGMALERDVVWVKGNHDWLLAEPLCSKFNMALKPCEAYSWEDVNGSNIAIHGHQFDSMITQHPDLTAIASGLYANLTQLAGPTVAEFLKHVQKVVSHDAKKVASGAAAYATENKFANIFCGHVHEYAFTADQGINYYNDGCCCSFGGTYLTIRDDGFIEQCNF